MDTRSEKDPSVLYDLRLVERHIRQGFVTRTDYEQFLAQLADREERVERVAFDESLLAARVRTMDFKLRDSAEPDESIIDD